MKRTKIIKKRTKHSDRFQSDMRKRVGVSNFSWQDWLRHATVVSGALWIGFLNYEKDANLLCFWRNPGGSQEVWTVSSDVSSEEELLCLPSEASRLEEQDTSSQAAWRSSWSETNRTWNCSWCTTEPTAVKSPRVSLLSRGKLSRHGVNLARFLHFRKSIVLRAKEMGVRLTNGNAKLKKASNEWAGSTHVAKTWS